MLKPDLYCNRLSSPNRKTKNNLQCEDFIRVIYRLHNSLHRFVPNVSFYWIIVIKRIDLLFAGMILLINY